MPEEKCKYCNKVFGGVNEKQAKSYLSVHLITQHADKVEIREITKGELNPSKQGDASHSKKKGDKNG